MNYVNIDNRKVTTTIFVMIHCCIMTMFYLVIALILCIYTSMFTLALCLV